jgi:hypothetical protein
MGPAVCLISRAQLLVQALTPLSSHPSSQGSATAEPALVGRLVLSVKSSTGETPGCNAVVRQGWEQGG